MIYNSGYDTTAGSINVTKQIVTAIQESIIKDNLDKVSLNVLYEGKYSPVFITGSLPSDVEIPLFTHPITINFKSKDYLVTDLRLFIKKDTPLENIESGIKNITEFNFNKSRGILNLIWLNNGVSQIKNGLPFAGIVFAGWLSDVISKNYALDFKDQTMLTILTHFYYQTLFSNETERDDDTIQRMAVHTIKATKAPAELVFGVIEKITKLNSINDYCNNVITILENVRLKNFNLAMLLTIVRNSWYGTNAKEIISIALEHPPTWCALVFTALNERTFKNSTVYKVAERFGKRGAADEFNITYTQLVKSALIKKEHLSIKDFG